MPINRRVDILLEPQIRMFLDDLIMLKYLS